MKWGEETGKGGGGCHAGAGVMHALEGCQETVGSGGGEGKAWLRKVK